MISRLFLQNTLTILALAGLLSACATRTQVTRTQDVPESADTPYKKVLVIALFESFDSRKYLEQEVVRRLSDLGTDAVASTSMMNSRMPATRPTFLAMVNSIGADSVMVTQLVKVETKAKVKTMNPQSTYNIRPTNYYNVWSVELTEYIEPKSVEFDNSVVMATQLYSVSSQESVWAIESRFKMVQKIDHLWDYSIYVEQANSITSHLSSDGLIAH